MADLTPTENPVEIALRTANDGLRRKIRSMELEYMQHSGRTSVLLAQKEKVISDLAAQLSDARQHIADIIASKTDEMKEAMRKADQSDEARKP